MLFFKVVGRHMVAVRNINAGEVEGLYYLLYVFHHPNMISSYSDNYFGVLSIR